MKLKVSKPEDRDAMIVILALVFAVQAIGNWIIRKTTH